MNASTRWNIGLQLLLVLVLSSQLSGCPLAVVGVAGGAMAVHDRRPAKTMLEDERIEVKANDLIYSDKTLEKKIHANITSYNHIVLLTGEVISEDLKKYAVDLVSNLDKVKRVHNELTVNSLANFSERSGDTWLTSKVKTKMLGSKQLDASRVKVVSEASTVYLMGLVTPEEGHVAAQLASETNGVEKVITLFEYIDPAEVEGEAKVQTPKLQKL